MEFPVEALLEWYRERKRDLPWRETDDVYSIWISEVMLQQTQVTTVIPYYRRFLERFPTVEALAQAQEQDVLKLWEGLGYYSRVRNLHKAAKHVMEEENGQIPENPEGFRKLPGVGPYIAAAVLSIARGIPLAAVDGNVLRVYTRFKGIGEDIRKTSLRNRITAELENIIPQNAAGDFTQSLMELGALICTPKNPTCDQCPLKSGCIAQMNGTVAQFPFKSPTKKVPVYNVSIGIVVKDNKFYIQKRPSEGHLGGLWEFPGGKSKKGETPEQTLQRELLEELGTPVQIVEKLARLQHAYSHFKINLEVFICRLKNESGTVQQPEGHPFRWIAIEELDDYPFPGANHKFFPRLRELFYREH